MRPSRRPPIRARCCTTISSIFRSQEGDRIDVAAIDANSLLPGDQAFSFIGSGAFTGMAGQLRFAGGFVQGDLNGDATADFMIHANALSLAAGDFVL